MKQGGFSGIVEAKEQDFGLLLPKTEGGQDAVEPVNEEHWWSRTEADRREIEGDLGRR